MLNALVEHATKLKMWRWSQVLNTQKEHLFGERACDHFAGRRGLAGGGLRAQAAAS
jgi:hypothetical protein